MVSLIFYYIRWHYSQGVRDLVNIVINFVWFFNEFFSIGLQFKTFFVPFHRLEDDRKNRGGLDIEAMAERAVVNVMMRIVGAVLRTILIIFGVVFILATIVLGFAFLLVWLLVPFFTAFIVMSGMALIVAG